MSEMQGYMGDQRFDECVSGLRRHIGKLGGNVKWLMEHPVFESLKEDHPADLGEMKANIMLAYRHLEDARMRLGKAIQAFDGGVSVYDK